MESTKLVHKQWETLAKACKLQAHFPLGSKVPLQCSPEIKI